MLDSKPAKGRSFCLKSGDAGDVRNSIIWIATWFIFAGMSAALGYAVNGVRIGFWAPLLSHGIQWAVCLLHAFPFQTEMFFDLTGSLTYILLTLFTLGFTVLDDNYAIPHPRQIICSSLVIIWAVRLGSYLFLRIQKETKDGRFDELKPYFVAFFGTWNIQGTWCFLTALAVFAVNSRAAASQPPLGWLDGVGIGVWAIGFGIEVIADRQKASWRALPSSKGRYIDVGLWRYSRHPNYFGEWLLWVGQFVLCSSAFYGDDAQGAFVGSGWLSALSFVFVYLLLNYVSGVPMLETKADARWGDEPAYQAYKKETFTFFLLPTRRTEASRPQLP